MTSYQHNLLDIFFKLKPLFLINIEYEDVYDFLIDCHELLHKMDRVERFGVELVIYQF